MLQPSLTYSYPSFAFRLTLNKSSGGLGGVLQRFHDILLNDFAIKEQNLNFETIIN